MSNRNASCDSADTVASSKSSGLSVRIRPGTSTHLSPAAASTREELVSARLERGDRGGTRGGEECLNRAGPRGPRAAVARPDRGKSARGRGTPKERDRNTEAAGELCEGLKRLRAARRALPLEHLGQRALDSRLHGLDDQAAELV